MLTLFLLFAVSLLAGFVLTTPYRLQVGVHSVPTEAGHQTHGLCIAITRMVTPPPVSVPDVPDPAPVPTPAKRVRKPKATPPADLLSDASAAAVA